MVWGSSDYLNWNTWVPSLLQLLSPRMWNYIHLSDGILFETNCKWSVPVMHNSDSGIVTDSGMIPIFAGIRIGIGIKNIKIEWNRNWNGNQWFQPWYIYQQKTGWNRNRSWNQTFKLTWNRNWNRNHTWVGIVHHWSVLAWINPIFSRFPF